MNKRALSPVIATVLLIALVLVLAVIIFLWARAFLPEQLVKEGSPIENKCGEVVFVAEYDSTSNEVVVLNQGNIPLHGVKIGIKKGFSLEFIEGDFTATIRGGETAPFEISSNPPESGNQIVVVPVLLGKTTNDELKSFVCDTSYGQTIDVQ